MFASNCNFVVPKYVCCWRLMMESRIQGGGEPVSGRSPGPSVRGLWGPIGPIYVYIYIYINVVRPSRRIRPVVSVTSPSSSSVRPSVPSTVQSSSSPVFCPSVPSSLTSTRESGSRRLGWGGPRHPVDYLDVFFSDAPAPHASVNQMP